MSEIRNLTGSVTSNDQECRAMGSPLLENGEKGGSRDAGGGGGRSRERNRKVSSHVKLT